MYPAPFRYHRVASLDEATACLVGIGEGARVLAGGQTLLVWLKLRFDEPTDLVDIGRIPGLDGIEHDATQVRIGALATHARIARSSLARLLPIVGDCGNGIADNQVRSRGTLGGSLAAGDPSCDWPVLMTALEATVHCRGPRGARSVPANGFVTDLYATQLQPGELITGVSFAVPAAGSGGAYVAFKRCAPAYPTTSVAVQLTLRGDHCEQARIALGSSALTPLRATTAEAELQGRALDATAIARAAEAAAAQAEPVADQRGSPEFKRSLIRALVRRGAEAAERRCRGENVEVSHEYY